MLPPEAGGFRPIDKEVPTSVPWDSWQRAGFSDGNYDGLTCIPLSGTTSVNKRLCSVGALLCLMLRHMALVHVARDYTILLGVLTRIMLYALT